MSIEKLPKSKKIMKIYVPDESKEGVPQTQRSDKTLLLKRTKKEGPQLLAADVVWYSQNRSLETQIEGIP